MNKIVKNMSLMVTSLMMMVMAGSLAYADIIDEPTAAEIVQESGSGVALLLLFVSAAIVAIIFIRRKNK